MREQIRDRERLRHILAAIERVKRYVQGKTFFSITHIGDSLNAITDVFLFFLKKLCSYNENDYFCNGMLNRTDCINILKKNKAVVSKRFGVQSMRLFGSVARNENNESSDVDICVEMEPNLLRRSGLKQYLESLLCCKVDVLRLHNNMDDFLASKIEQDGIIIFKQ